MKQDTFVIQGYNTKPSVSYEKYTNELCGEVTHHMHYEKDRLVIKRLPTGEQKCVLTIGDTEILVSNHQLYNAWHWAEYGVTQ